jgi:hypothetical protein
VFSPQAFFGDCRQVLIAAKNIPGVPNRPMTKAGLYPMGNPAMAGYLAAMNILLLVVVLLLLFGGGGFYFGGPVIGGSGLGLLLLICLVVFLMGGFRSTKN